MHERIQQKLTEVRTPLRRTKPPARKSWLLSPPSSTTSSQKSLATRGRKSRGRSPNYPCSPRNSPNIGNPFSLKLASSAFTVWTPTKRDPRRTSRLVLSTPGAMTTKLRSWRRVWRTGGIVDHRKMGYIIAIASLSQPLSSFHSFSSKQLLPAAPSHCLSMKNETNKARECACAIA